MRSQNFTLFVLTVSILLNYHQSSAQQFTTDDTQLDSSEEFENQVITESQRNYHEGFKEIVSFLNSINATMEKISIRLENVEKNVNVLNSTLNQRNQGHIVRWEILETELISLKSPLKIDKIQKLLLHPRARVYSGENYTGEYEDIENVTGGCVREDCGAFRKLSGRVKSIQTFGTCVRLFQSTTLVLDGWSLAVYPGSTIPADVLTSKLAGVKGIGLCLPDEFDGATIDYLTQRIKKNHSDVRTTVPDLVEFLSRAKGTKGISMNTRHSSRDKYLLGPFNRVEYLRKEVHKNDFDPTPKPTSAMETTAFYRSLDRLPEDVVGFGIPVALGGQANETFNIFPQTPRGAEEWLRITSDIPSFVSGNSYKWVIIVVNFMYENDNSTRPYAFYYWVSYNHERISYGRVRN